MTPQQLSAFEGAVRAAVVRAHKAGINTDVATWGVVHNRFTRQWEVVKAGMACGLGCLLIEAGSMNEDKFQTAVPRASKVPISWEEIDAFTRGWDGKSFVANQDLYNLGQRMRKFAQLNMFGSKK